MVSLGVFVRGIPSIRNIISTTESEPFCCCGHDISTSNTNPQIYTRLAKLCHLCEDLGSRPYLVFDRNDVSNILPGIDNITIVALLGKLGRKLNFADSVILSRK